MNFKKLFIIIRSNQSVRKGAVNTIFNNYSIIKLNAERGGVAKGNI